MNYSYDDLLRAGISELEFMIATLEERATHYQEAVVILRERQQELADRLAARERMLSRD